MTRYRIVAKKDWPTSHGLQGFWRGGEWISTGYVVVDTSGCNAMPGATWFQTIAEAVDAARIWHAARPNSDLFWKLYRRWMAGSRTDLPGFLKRIRPQYGLVLNDTRRGYLWLRDEVVGSADRPRGQDWIVTLYDWEFRFPSASCIYSYLKGLNAGETKDRAVLHSGVIVRQPMFPAGGTSRTDAAGSAVAHLLG